MAVDTVPGFTQDQSTGLFVPSITNTPIPWADLGAQPLPTDNPQLGNALIPTVSAMAVQGSISPKLVPGNNQGEPYVAAKVAFAANVARNQVIGDHNVTFDDLSFGRGGFWFYTQQLGTNGGLLDGPYFGVPTSDPFTVHIDNALGTKLTVGDYAFAVPFVTVMGAGSAIDVTDRAARLLGHVTIDGQPIGTNVNNSIPLHVSGGIQTNGATNPAAGDVSGMVDNAATRYVMVRTQRRTDGIVTGVNFGGGATVGLTVGASPGFAIVIDEWYVDLANVNGATNWAEIVTFSSTGAGGKTLTSLALNCKNQVGDIDRASSSNPCLFTATGQGFSISYSSAIPANFTANISLSFHVE